MKLEPFIQIFILCILVSQSQACVSDLQQFINNLINIITPPTPTPTTTTPTTTTTTPTTTTPISTNTTTTAVPTTTTTTPFGYCPYGSVFNGSQCEECGLSDFADNLKIFNGIEAVPHSWPSQVLIYREYTFKINGVMAVASDMCGGTLIKRNVVLTAGHCITDDFVWKGNKVKYVPNIYNPTFESTFLVYLGIHDISFIFGATSLPDNAQNPSVAKIIIHKDFNATSLQNDIGLLILKNSVELNSYVKLACLPEKESSTIPKPDLPAWILGWGLNENNKIQLKLQNVKISTYNSSMCSAVLPQIPKIWDAQICAGNYNGSLDSCQGDSGGPLLIQETIGDATKRIVVGVVSYGDDCGLPNKPGIYTRVSYYRDWIENSINNYFNSTSSIL